MANRKEYELLFALNAKVSGGYTAAFNSAQREMVAMQKEVAELRRSQSDISAYQKQQKALETSQQSMVLYQKQLNNVQVEIKESGQGNSDLANKELALQSKIATTSAKITEKKQKLDQMGAALREAGVNTDNLTKESDRLGGELEQLKKAQEEVAQGAEEFGQSSVDAISALQGTLAAAAIAKGLKEIYDWYKACAAASIEFESAMTGVAKTTDFTDAEFAQITDEIMEMSTVIPAAKEDLAAVAEAAGQLGIAKEDLLGFTEVMTMMGTSTNLSADQAATSLAKFANITKMRAEDYGRIGATVVGLGNNFATTEADIVAMGMRLAGAGSLTGLNQAEIMGVATALSSVGIEAEAGGSAISKLMKQFETMVAVNSPALKDFAKVAGMSSKEFSAAWKDDAVSALSSFIDGLSGIDAAGGSSIATLEALDLKEIRLSDAILRLSGSNGILEKAVSLANTSWEENVALTDEAAKRYATTESILDMTESAYDNLTTVIGNQFTPALRDAGKATTGLLNEATAYVKENPQTVAAVVGTTTAVTGFAGALVVAKGAMLAVNASKALLLMTAPLNPLVMGISIVAALTAGVVAYKAATQQAQDETEGLTYYWKEQYYRIQDLEDEYRALCDEKGETSTEAQLLRRKIDEETEAFERNKRSAEETANAYASTRDEYNKLIDAYNEKKVEISSAEESTTNLLNSLEQLLAIQDKSTEDQMKLLSTVDLLNQFNPEWDLVYDQETGVLSHDVGDLQKNNEQKALDKNFLADYDQYMALEQGEEGLRAEYETANQEAVSSWRAYQAALKEFDSSYDPNGENLGKEYDIYERQNAVDDAKDAYDANQQAAETAYQQWRESQEKQKEYIESVDEFVQKMSEIVGRQLTIVEAVESARENGVAVPDGLNSPNKYAVGTRSAAPGWAWVGEQGPELMHMRGGESVISAARSAEIASTGGTPFVFSPTYQIEGVSNAAEVEAALRNHDEKMRDFILQVIRDAQIDAQRRRYN